jgi:hypothetical protein
MITPGVVVCNHVSLVLASWRRGLRTTCCSRRGSSTNHANHSIWCILSDHIWRVNHVELPGSILARKSQDGQLAARVVLEKVRDIENLASDNDPAVGLAGVLGHLIHGVPGHIWWQADNDTVTSAAATSSDHTNDLIWRVLPNHIRRVDQVELLGGILASERQNGQLAARVILEAASDLKHPEKVASCATASVDDNVAAPVSVVELATLVLRQLYSSHGRPAINYYGAGSSAHGSSLTIFVARHIYLPCD